MKQKAKICALPWLLPYIIASVIFLPIAVATISPTHGLMLLAWVVIVFIALIHTFVLRLGKQVYITDRAVGFKTGILSKDVTEMSLSKIETIEIHQSIIAGCSATALCDFAGPAPATTLRRTLKIRMGSRIW
jgi:uncharacterized membrane protein YdbT with pleckstrin-like domain